MYHVKTNKPGETIKPCINAYMAIERLKEIPEGWQASVEYCKCEIWYGMIGDRPLPTVEQLIKGACNINGVD